MANATKFNGLLSQMGILSPSERAQLQYQQQMEQLHASIQMRNQNLQAGQLGTSFGFPVYMMEQAVKGGGRNSTFKIPDLPQMEDTSAQEGVVRDTIGNDLPSQGGISGTLKQSDQYMLLAKRMLEIGDTNRASLLQQMAVQARYDEEELALKQEAEARQQAELMKPENLGTVGVTGQPTGRQELQRQFNPRTGAWDIKPMGPAYEVGSQDVNVNLPGEMFTGAKKQERLQQFSELTENTLNFFSSATGVYDLLSSGAASGFTGDAMTAVDNALATAKTSLSLLTDDDKEIRDMVSEELRANNKKWDNVLAKTQLSQAGFVGLAYTLASSYNKDGRISDNDMRKALEELGGNLSDPASARRVLREAVVRAGGRLKNAYRITKHQGLDDDLERMYNDVIGDFTQFEESTRGLDSPRGEVPQFKTEEEALASGVKGEVMINGRRARIE